jgi:hypothetical protein
MGSLMKNARNALAAVLAMFSIVLTACSTNIELQVPQINSPEFVDCLKDPTTSYKLIKAARSLPVLGADLDAVTKVTKGSARLFGFDDPSMATEGLELADDAWAQTAALQWHTTAADLTRAANTVDQLWSHPVHRAFLTSFNELTKPGEGSVANPPGIASSDVLDYLRLTRTVVNTDAWDAMAARSAAALSVLMSAHRETLSAEANSRLAKKAQLLEQKMMGAIFVSTYLKAYFRNGNFVTLNWNLGNPLSDLEQLGRYSSADDKAKVDKIIADLQSLDPDAKSQLQSIINKDLKGSIGKIADSGLITRGGDSLAMPAITLTADVTQTKPLSGTKVDANAVLEDVVRVTFEALFDSINGVPAVTKATAVSGLPVEYQGSALPDFAKVGSAYRESSPGVPGPTMDSDSFGKVDADGAKAQALTASAMASVIRGANIAALNNESLANTLTMIAATTARKVMERVTWCYYAVVGPQPEGSLASLNSSPRDSRTVTFSLKH